MIEVAAAANLWCDNIREANLVSDEPFERLHLMLEQSADEARDWLVDNGETTDRKAVLAPVS